MSLLLFLGIDTVEGHWDLGECLEERRMKLSEFLCKSDTVLFLEQKKRFKSVLFSNSCGYAKFIAQMFTGTFRLKLFCSLVRAIYDNKN